MNTTKLSALLLALSISPWFAQAEDIANAIEVTPENFIRAESDRYFFITQQLAGGVNKLNFNRTVTPLEEQTVVRMNRDTLYGAVVVDTKGGATITFPEIPDGRYASVLVLDNDHYAPMVIYEPGTYKLPERTRYVLLAIRVHLLNPDDPADIKKATEIQDQFVIHADSSEPFTPPNWDKASLDKLRTDYEAEMVKYDRYPDGWQGTIEEVDESTRHIAVAGGWGLLPNRDALYINYNGQLSDKKCYSAVYEVPKNRGFWSITMYGNDGYMKSDNSILNGFNTKLNDDGKSFTAYFGSKELCGDVSNRLDTSEGWNFLMRIYRADASVLKGEYSLPVPHEFSK